FLGQPTQEYISDLNQFISDYNKFDSFKDVLYPIPRMSNNDTTTSLLQMVGALYGRTLSQSEIDSLGSYVDLSLLKTENPYSNLTPLKDLGFLGVFNKKSPASDVFSQETFSEEIEDLLSLDSFYSTYEEIPVEKQKKKVVAYKEISTDNKEYFDNYSFTLSYSFLLNSWVSYHSYLPLYYIEANNHFYSGVNDEIWEHTNNIKYNNFYGKIFPYIIEFPYFYKYNDEILQYIEDYTKVYKPLSKSDNDFIKVEDKYFDKAVIFNDVQNSGYLNLKKKPDHDMSAYLTYPKYNNDSKDILYTLSNTFYKYNTFWNALKDPNMPQFKKGLTLNIPEKLDNSNIDYTQRDFKKESIRSKDIKIRHILDSTDEYKLVSQFLLTQT
ncbi:MAG TPA: hypothetical protein VK031_04140, partial [Tissierellaceae bacterium]|nr:hypothetical protein [Tissierellaceae bacterium]